VADLSEEQLLHLVDRAEAGTLLAEEALLLRDGIRRYATAERVVLAAFNAAKQVVAAVVPAFQQLGLLPEQTPAECSNCEGSGIACSWCNGTGRS
jgi:hypothetical protein